MSKIWLITGCSSGFGREIALAAAQSGDIVVATARDPSKVTDLTAEAQAGEGKIIARRLDVLAKDEEMKATIDDIVAAVGRIDVLVNNAGYVLEGAIEECSYEEVSAQFATNVFGQLNVIRAAAPHMRSAQPPGGVIANLGSIGGWHGTSAAGIYCATKAAVAIYSEALRAELAPFGIDVVCIEPGYFRTRLLTGGNKNAAKKRIPELERATQATREAFERLSERQPGDPAKGARVVVDGEGEVRGEGVAGAVGVGERCGRGDCRGVGAE